MFKNLIIILMSLVCINSVNAQVVRKPAPALGAKAPTTPTDKGFMWVNVVDYGAKTDVGFDNSVAFQAAHDDLASRLAKAPPGLNWQGTVFVPSASNPYMFGSPVFCDYSGIKWLGEGGGSICQSGNISKNGISFLNCPVFAFGVRRPSKMTGNFATNFNSYRPDLFGKLDTSLVPAANQRWGYRTNTDSFIYSLGSSFSHGARSAKFGGDFVDCWAETNTLTIEFCVEGFVNGLLPMGTMICAIDNMPGSNQNCPFKVYINGNNQFAVDFRTQATQWAPGVNCQTVQVPQVPGVQKVAIQIDLVKGMTAIWINNIQRKSGANGLVPGNTHFYENEDFPFTIGTDGIANYSVTTQDFALYGFSMSKTLRYSIRVDGTSQVRADGKPITDSYRYGDDGTDRTNLIGFLAFTEPPNVNNPMLSIPSPATSAPSSPAWIGYKGQLGFGGIGDLGIKDMNIQNIRPYGFTIGIGQVLNFEMINCNVQGGFWAVASMQMGSVYPLLFDRCRLSSYGDAAIYLDFAIAQMTNTTIQNGGRVNMRFRECDIDIFNTFIAGANSNCRTSVMSYHGGENGGDVGIRKLIQDQEWGPPPLKNVFYIERGSAGAMVRLIDVNAGVANGCIFLELNAGPRGQDWPSNIIETDNARAAGITSYSTTTGTGWQGTFKNSGTFGSP